MNLTILTMGGHSRLLVLMCLFAITLNSVAQQEEAWTWKDRNGNTKTRAELDKILADHKTWVESEGERGSMANLSSADLRGADLRGADLNNAELNFTNLIGADLSDAVLSNANLLHAELLNANLIDANLSGANLIDADLSDAVLSNAILSDAILKNADLRGADLNNADLRGADLNNADLNFTNLIGADLSEAILSDAILFGANLSDSYLIDANLSDAVLYGANLDGANYEPANPPLIESIAFAMNLDRLIYGDAYTQIIATLKRALKDAGFHTQHRQVIAAIRRHDASRFDFDTVMFDWTCEFGANPTRPLWIVSGIWLLCTVFYWLLLHRRKGSGLYLLATGRKVNTGNERVFVQRLRYRHPPRNKWYKYMFRVLRRKVHALGTAVLFSLMSAFNIGFRELNFGRWIRMLQPREFDIKAHGMARVISGTQSLLSIYLVALAVLSYFGTPFDR